MGDVVNSAGFCSERPKPGLEGQREVMNGRGEVRGEQGLAGWGVATSNHLRFGSMCSCLDFDAVFQQRFRERYLGIPKLRARLSIFT